MGGGIEIAVLVVAVLAIGAILKLLADAQDYIRQEIGEFADSDSRTASLCNILNEGE